MKKMIVFAVCVVLFSASMSWAESVTADEVKAKVLEAAAFLEEKGAEGLSEFMDPDGRWVWKDTYIWILECDKLTAAAHPISHKFVGRDNADLVDKKGNYFFMQICDDVAAHPEGYWTEYWWPKIDQEDPARKVAFTVQVKGTPYQASAGIYSDDADAAQLNAK